MFEKTPVTSDLFAPINVIAPKIQQEMEEKGTSSRSSKCPRQLDKSQQKGILEKSVQAITSSGKYPYLQQWGLETSKGFDPP